MLLLANYYHRSQLQLHLIFVQQERDSDVDKYMHPQEQLLVSQEALKAAKTESARRLKTVQSLQQQVRARAPFEVYTVLLTLKSPEP